MPPRAATLDGTAGTQPQPAPVGLLRQLAAWGRRRWQYYGAPRKTAAVRWLQRRHLLPTPRPIILHITHYKAGSQWVAEVLKQCMAAKNVVPPQEKGQHFATVNLRPGALFPTVYAARPYVTTVAAKTTLSIRQFVVIRDLRDTLVSLYFSNRYSHVSTGRMAERRAILERLSLEEGLLALLDLETRIELDANSMLQRGSGPLFDTAFRQCAQIQRSWIKAKDCLLVRYEDLVANEQATFRRIIDYCGIQVDKRRLRKIVAANSFEAQTGRKPGQEDVMAHRRKGIVGDWRNYFTPAVTAEFKVRYGDLLILTGYEKNLNW